MLLPIRRLGRRDPVALPLRLPVGDSTPTGTGAVAEVLNVDDALRPTCEERGVRARVWGWVGCREQQNGA